MWVTLTYIFKVIQTCLSNKIYVAFHFGAADVINSLQFEIQKKKLNK